MKLASPQLERRLRDAVQKEVRGSEKLYREWKSRRGTALRWRIATTIVRHTVIISTTAAALSYGLLLVIFGKVILDGVMGGKPIRGGGPQFFLGLQSVLFAGLLSWIAGASNRSYFSLLRLPVYACFPLDDHCLVRRRAWRTWLVAAFLSMIAIIPSAMILIRENLGGMRLAAAIALIGVLWLVALGCGLVAVAFSPRSRRWRARLSIAGSMLFLFGPFIGMASFNQAPGLVAYVRACLYLTPPGWVATAYLEGHLRGNNLAWWFLLPAIGVLAWSMPLVWQRAQTRFVLAEFAILPNRRWFGVLERGFRVPAAPGDLPLPHFWQPSPLGRVVLTADEASQRVSAGDYLRRLPPTKIGFIERAAAGVLNDRQLAIVENWSKSFAESTREWRDGWLTLVFVSLLVWLCSLVEAFRGVPLVACLGLFLVYVGNGDGYAACKATMIGHLPLSLGEACRAMGALELVRCVFWSPLVLAFAAFGIWVIGGDAWLILPVSLLLLIARIVLQVSRVCEAVTFGTQSAELQFFDLCWFSANMIVAAAAAALPFQEVPPRTFTAIALLILVLPCLLCGLQFRAYYRGKLDLIPQTRKSF